MIRILCSILLAIAAAVFMAACDDPQHRPADPEPAIEPAPDDRLPPPEREVPIPDRPDRIPVPTVPPMPPPPGPAPGTP